MIDIPPREAESMPLLRRNLPRSRNPPARLEGRIIDYQFGRIRRSISMPYYSTSRCISSDSSELIIDERFSLAGGLRDRGRLRLSSGMDCASLGGMSIM